MSNATQWQQDMESTGTVRIGTTMSSLIWRVALAAVIASVFLYTQYASEKIGQQVLYLAIGGFALLILGAVVFARTRYGDKHVQIDRHGFTNTDGTTYSWSDIEGVGVFSAPRSVDALQLELTDDAWHRHLSMQSAAGSLMHKGNKLVTRGNSIVLPSFLDADPAELATWLNQYARGRGELHDAAPIAECELPGQQNQA